MVYAIIGSTGLFFVLGAGAVFLLVWQPTRHFVSKYIPWYFLSISTLLSHIDVDIALNVLSHFASFYINITNSKSNWLGAWSRHYNWPEDGYHKMCTSELSESAIQAEAKVGQFYGSLPHVLAHCSWSRRYALASAVLAYLVY